MKQSLLAALWLSCIAVCSYAQVEVPPPERMKSWLAGYEAAAKEATPFAAHLKRLAKASDKVKANGYRVSLDFAGQPDRPFYCYAVPAMSETQYLPDAYPLDGEAGKGARIIMARNEYEPASFVIYAAQDLGKVDFAIGALKNAGGALFPKDQLDLKVVKVWYQNGNGWYSYFQDKQLKLCPELLLNDEELIKVDTKAVANYARLTAKDGTVTYRWLTAPTALENRIEDAPGYRLDETFCSMKADFQDADSFRGATLGEGAFKQFFLTARTTGKEAPGLYRGAITLSRAGQALGEVPVEIRVLPFDLPKPKTYFDREKDFLSFFCEYVSLEHVRQLNGNDAALAEKQLVEILKDFARHGETIPNHRDAYGRPDLNDAAGLDSSTFCTGRMLLSDPADMRYDARRQRDDHLRRFGNVTNYYLSWGDEFGLGTLRGVRPMIDIYKTLGFRFPVNSRHGYAAGGYLADLFWPPVTPDYENASLAASKLNALGGDAYFGWYASQHVGVENPAYIRRQYGLAPYRAGLSCHFNYAHHLNGYNDVRGNTYRSMNFVYADYKGVIDTLSWEAFREGLDDIRYATKLQQLAHPLVRSADLRARYTAKKALQLLADMNTDDFDLSTARLEMTRFILELQAFTK